MIAELHHVVALTTQCAPLDQPRWFLELEQWVRAFFLGRGRASLDELRYAACRSAEFCKLGYPKLTGALRSLVDFGVLVVVAGIRGTRKDDKKTKTCACCRRVLPRTNEHFYVCRGAKDGLQGRCVRCTRARDSRRVRAEVAITGQARDHRTRVTVGRKLSSDATPMASKSSSRDYHEKYRGVRGPIIFGCVSDACLGIEAAS